MRSSRSPICVMSSSASSRGRPRPTSSALCCPGLGKLHRPRPPSRADARGAVATLTENPQIEPPVLGMRNTAAVLELDPAITPRMQQQAAHHTVSTDVFADHAPLL